MAENIGHVIQITGPAVDVQFTEAAMPPIYQALRVVSDGFNVPAPINVVLEVQQHLGEGRVRTIAMEATDGMVRGMKAIDQGGPISAPVGRGTLGRVMNVIGEPVDNLGPKRVARPAFAIDGNNIGVSKQTQRWCIRVAAFDADNQGRSIRQGRLAHHLEIESGVPEVGAKGVDVAGLVAGGFAAVVDAGVADQLAEETWTHRVKLAPCRWMRRATPS